MQDRIEILENPSFGIASPQLLHIANIGGIRSCGGHQDWYRKIWQRMSGCGPVAASNIALYLARSRKGCKALAKNVAPTKEGFLSVMNDMWQYVTPTMHGVHTTEILKKGCIAFGASHGVSLGASVLEIPEEPSQRPDPAALFAFLADSFSLDVPVAFLNLHNGKVKGLDSWHWVTLVECSAREGTALMYDQGQATRLDMLKWLSQTRLGGGFVAIAPEAELADCAQRPYNRKD